MDPVIDLVRDDRGGVTVMVDGTPQSHVQQDDPRLLTFEYVQHLALVIDTLPPGPLAVTHVGGAGLTLPRYVNAVRPGSPQIVLEPDTALTELVRRELPLPRQHRIRVRPVDGATGVAALRAGSADVLVIDAYAGGRVPAELTTVAFLTAVRGVLSPDGVALLNVADEPGLRFVARVAASLSAAGFDEVALLATHEVLKGKRFGNTVLVASAPGAVDLATLVGQVASAPLPTGIRHGEALRRLVAGARPLTDADAAASPEAPPVGRWRVR